MPTINQLVRKGSQDMKSKKSKAPGIAMDFELIYSSVVTHQPKGSPQKRGVCTQVKDNDT